MCLVAFWQAGEVDPWLQVGVYMTDINGTIDHHVYGPIPLETSTTLDVDVLFYARTDGSIVYHLSGLGLSNFWQGSSDSAYPGR
jgi:hypothetical protein